MLSKTKQNKTKQYLLILPHPEKNNLAQEEAPLCLRYRRQNLAITFILLSLHDLNTFKSQLIRMKTSRKERLFRVTEKLSNPNSIS